MIEGNSPAKVDRILKLNQVAAVEDVEVLDAEKVKKLLGNSYSNKVTDNVMISIRSMGEDVDMEQSIMEEMFQSNADLIRGTNTNISKYIDAVKFCAMKKHMGPSLAWELTYPDKMLDYKKRKAEEPGFDIGKRVTKNAAAYKDTAMVVSIETRMLISWSISRSSDREDALDSLIEMSKGKCAPNKNGDPQTVSPNIQMQALSKVIDVLEPMVDKTAKAEAVSGTGLQDALASELAKMRTHQVAMLEKGYDIGEVQRIGLGSGEEIIDAEVE